MSAAWPAAISASMRAPSAVADSETETFWFDLLPARRGPLGVKLVGSNAHDHILRLGPPEQGRAADVCQIVHSAFRAYEPTIDIAQQDLRGIIHPQLEVAGAARSIRQRRGTDQRSLSVCRHDRCSRPTTFDGIPMPAQMLFDETGPAPEIPARRRRCWADDHLDIASRRYAKQAETKASAEITEAGITLPTAVGVR